MLCVVASTNRELTSMVEAGEFREDLFYRLNVMSIRVPALRERVEDVSELSTHFLGSFAEEFGKEFSGFTSAAMARLEAHDWPGNVRELRNTVERAALLGPGGSVLPEHLGLGENAGEGALLGGSPDTRGGLPLGDRSLKAMEEALIRRVLEENAGNRSRSARVLGINRTTLYNKLRAYGIDL